MRERRTPELQGKVEIVKSMKSTPPHLKQSLRRYLYVYVHVHACT